MGKLSRTISRSLVTLHQGIPTIPLIVKGKQREVWWYWSNERKSGCCSLLGDKFCESLKHLKRFLFKKKGILVLITEISADLRQKNSKSKQMHRSAQVRELELVKIDITPSD